MKRYYSNGSWVEYIEESDRLTKAEAQLIADQHNGKIVKHPFQDESNIGSKKFIKTFAVEGE